jgi:hypothetical protein
LAAFLSADKFKPVSSVILYDMKPEIRQKLVTTVQVIHADNPWLDTNPRP